MHMSMEVIFTIMIKLKAVLKFLAILGCCFMMVSCSRKQNENIAVENQNDVTVSANAKAEDNKITPTIGVIDGQVNQTTTPNITPTVNPTQPPNDKDDSTNTETNNNPTATFDLEAFKNILINAVNDDIWYQNTVSSYRSFAMQTLNMEIFTNVNKPSSIWLILNNPQEKGMYPYFVVEFISDKRGFLDEDNMCFTVATQKEAEEYIQNEGFAFYLKTDISFGEASQPIYPDTTNEKEKVIDNILGTITQDMEWFKYDVGTYKVHVDNFRDNSSKTFALIENSDGKTWAMEIAIYDDGSTDIMQTYDDVAEEWATLLKDSAVRETDITIQ